MSSVSVESSVPFDIIDFHNHHVPARFKLTAAQAAPANQRARWEVIARRSLWSKAARSRNCPACASW
jgi:hypothetical protein